MTRVITAPAGLCTGSTTSSVKSVAGFGMAAAEATAIDSELKVNVETHA